jgi:hypothetical protein
MAESMLIQAAGKPEPLNLDSPTVAQDWSEWKESWESYTLAAGIDDLPKKNQVGMFLWCLNKKAMGLWKAFEFANEQEKHDLKIVMDKFDQYFRPRTNVTCERYKFWTMKAKPEATFEQILAQVRTQLQKCAFENVKPEKLARDKLITMIQDSTLQKSLLRKADLQLDDLIAEARSPYNARCPTEECESLGRAQTSVNELSAGRNQSRDNCGRCGRAHRKG